MPQGFSVERPAGAGRTLDVWYPGTELCGQNGTAFPLATQAKGRPGPTAPASSGYTQSQNVTGTGAVRWATGTGWNGRGGVQCFPGAAGTAKNHTGFVINPALGAAALNGYVKDPMSCYRMIHVLSFGAGNTFGAAVETGAVWTADAAGTTSIRNGAAGFGFIQNSAGEVYFSRRSVAGGGVLTEVSALVSDAAGLLKFHAYEIRVIGATDTQNAKLKAFVDGVPVNLQGVNGPTLDWVDDGLPNPLNTAGNLYGFHNWIHANGTGAAATGIVFHRIFLQAAPTETDLL